MLRRVPILLLVFHKIASAQVLPPLDIQQRYEEQLIADTLKAMGLVPDPAPMGKTVERIEVAPHDVFVQGFDPIPDFFNVFHVTTKPYILKQELLFKEGDVIGPDTLEESERNLRSFFVLSVARLATAKGSSPDRVVVVVVAKDLWTLRPNMNFSYENGNLDLFSLTLAEHNLFGRNKFFGLNFRMDPATFWWGEHYTDPRVMGTRIAADEQFLLITNRDTGGAEGVITYLTFGRPLFSLATEWGWDAGIKYVDGVQRTFVDGMEQFMYSYDQSLLTMNADVRRSFGRRWKSNFTAGYEIDANKFDPRVGTKLQFVPVSETDSQLFLRYDFFEARYVTYQNIGAYALTEDFQLGPAATVSVSWAPQDLGTQAADAMNHLHGVSFTRLFASAGWRFRPTLDDILWMGGSVDVRYEPDYWKINSTECLESMTTPWVDRIESLGLYNISPRFLWSRLITRATLALRNCDVTNTLQGLGGTSGLRGYPANEFLGHNLYILNAELRTKPISLWTMYVGAVAFWDGGGVWLTQNGSNYELNGITGVQYPAAFHQDAGVGLRVQWPQFNHYVVRVDLAFPFDSNATSPVLTAAFDQAF